MITLTDIQTAVAALLKANGYSVIASEVKEGFNKPACFIEVMPVSAAIENRFSERITDSVEISYFPALETKEELLKNAENFKNIFLYTPISVQDRFLSVNEITFDTDKSVLLAYFELEFLQEIQSETETLPKMKVLNERMVTNSNGTSKDID